MICIIITDINCTIVLYCCRCFDAFLVSGAVDDFKKETDGGKDKGKMEGS